METCNGDCERGATCKILIGNGNDKWDVDVVQLEPLLCVVTDPMKSVTKLGGAACFQGRRRTKKVHRRIRSQGPLCRMVVDA